MITSRRNHTETISTYPGLVPSHSVTLLHRENNMKTEGLFAVFLALAATAAGQPRSPVPPLGTNTMAPGVASSQQTLNPGQSTPMNTAPAPSNQVIQQNSPPQFPQTQGHVHPQGHQQAMPQQQQPFMPQLQQPFMPQQQQPFMPPHQQPRQPFMPPHQQPFMPQMPSMFQNGPMAPLNSFMMPPSPMNNMMPFLNQMMNSPFNPMQNNNRARNPASSMLPFALANGDMNPMAAMMMMRPGQQNSALPLMMMSGNDMWPLMAMMGNRGNNKRRGFDPLMMMALGGEMI